MSKQDYYETLGVSKNADAKTIKKAYRKLAIKYHPDKNPGDKQAEEKFKEAAEAYSVLSDKDKKDRYDQLGHQQYQQFDSQGGGGFSGGGINPEDIFNNLFGRILRNSQTLKETVQLLGRTSMRYQECTDSLKKHTY